MTTETDKPTAEELADKLEMFVSNDGMSPLATSERIEWELAFSFVCIASAEMLRSQESTIRERDAEIERLGNDLRLDCERADKSSDMCIRLREQLRVAEADRDEWRKREEVAHTVQAKDWRNYISARKNHDADIRKMVSELAAARAELDEYKRRHAEVKLLATEFEVRAIAIKSELDELASIREERNEYICQHQSQMDDNDVLRRELETARVLLKEIDETHHFTDFWVNRIRRITRTSPASTRPEPSAVAEVPWKTNPSQYEFEVLRDILTLMRRMSVAGPPVSIEIRKPQTAGDELYDWSNNREHVCGPSELSCGMRKGYEAAEAAMRDETVGEAAASQPDWHAMYATLWRRVVQAAGVGNSDTLPIKRAIHEVEQWARERKQLRDEIEKLHQWMDEKRKVANTWMDKSNRIECEFNGYMKKLAEHVGVDMEEFANPSAHGNDRLRLAILVSQKINDMKDAASQPATCPPMSGKEICEYVLSLPMSFEKSCDKLSAHIWPQPQPDPQHAEQILQPRPCVFCGKMLDPAMVNAVEIIRY